MFLNNKILNFSNRNSIFLYYKNGIAFCKAKNKKGGHFLYRLCGFFLIDMEVVEIQITVE
jgi:hypothetical protein